MGEHYSKTKIMWGNIIAIHSVFFKKHMKQNSQQAQYKKNKIDKDHFEKKNIHKNKEKKPCRETL